MLWLVGGVVGMVACGPPTTPEGFPELTGEYIARLTAAFTSVPGGVQTSGVPCTATLAVSRQTGDTFEGTYDRGFPCVRVRAVPPRVGDERWRGEVDGDELTLRIDAVLACPQTGSQRTVATITGRRGQPR